ncbi:MAG TPA: hypothetical protein VL523_04910 [Terriglobia bacterium]|nr:hypothetical protein [Terriglobia bacterium]
MKVVEFLKKVGGVTVPGNVIKQAGRSGKKVEGTLTITRLTSGNVLVTFAPIQGQGVSRPLLPKDLGQAESDLIATFGFSASEAQSWITKVEQSGEAAGSVMIDEALASNLFLYRQL